MIIVVAAIVFLLSVVIIQWVSTQSSSLSALTAAFCLAAAAFYFIALHDTYAPAVLGLPSHHCPFCLFQEFPDTAVFAGLFWLGIASAGWGVVLRAVWAREGLNLEGIHSLLGLLRKVSSVALVFSVVSMISHILLVL
jgi:hypothetical protein